MQAVLYRLQEQQLSALFTSSQKRGSIQQLLQTIMRRLKADKPNADMLMIMAVGKLALHAYIHAGMATSWLANPFYPFVQPLQCLMGYSFAQPVNATFTVLSSRVTASHQKNTRWEPASAQVA